MLEPPVEEEARPNSVEISVGTVFSFPSFMVPEGRVDVIVDIGKGHNFSSAEMRYSPAGKRMIRTFGTAGSDSIGKIVEQLTVEEVIEALREGGRNGGFYSVEMESILCESANEGSRILVLSR